MERTSAKATVVAAPAEVMAVIADFAAYPSWASGVKRAEVVEDGPGGRPRRVRFELETGPVHDTYELAYSWDGDRSVSWELVAGEMQRAQQGSYELREADGGTEVTYSLAVELAVPMPGLVKRQAEKRIIGAALDGLRKRVAAARR